jgi:hypothetical protein
VWNRCVCNRETRIVKPQVTEITENIHAAFQNDL